jgi:predicted Ser/Thr protein kinase
MQSDVKLVPGDRFARRFTVESILGSGAYGTVYRATDRITGLDTALKVLRPERRAAFTSRWREAAMLRRLGLPGVARLIAEGIEDDQPYLAMEFVDGRPFPRPTEPLPWEMIEDSVAALLRTLALVHSAGIVHGDLKPGNVLLDEFGRLTVVDFGLSLSAVANDLESTRLQGTPLYMAPELFQRNSIFSAQTDLFAVGAMIFEALTGRPFFRTANMVEWVRLLTTKGPPRLSDVVEAPDPVALELCDALLAHSPAHRPDSAWDALRLLGPKTGAEARWLGDDTAIRDARERLVSESLVVAGPEGAGKTAFVNAVVQQLRSHGHNVYVVPRGDRPFESLIRLDTLDATWPSDLDEPGLTDHAERVIGGCLDDGAYVAVPRGENRVDDWSFALLSRMARQRSGIVLATSDAHDSNLRLDRFDTDELASLFAGPELGFHLPSRASQLLMNRTEGRRGRVFAEIESWKRFNLAQTENDGRIRVSDRSLTLLEQGLQTQPPVSHRSLDERSWELVCWMSLIGSEISASSLVDLTEWDRSCIDETLSRLEAAGVASSRAERWRLMRQPGHFDRVGARSRMQAIERADSLGLLETEQRFRLELLNDDVDGLVTAALSAADEAFGEGRRHSALSIARESCLAVKQRDATSEAFDRLVWRWTRYATMRSDGGALEEILWTLGDREHELRDYVEAMRMGEVNPGPEALEMLAKVDDTGDPWLDRNRRFNQMSSLARTGGDLQAHLESVREWGRRCDDPEVEAVCLMWEARLCKMREEYGRAAELAAAAAERREHLLGQVNARTAQASALLEDFRLAEAREVASLIVNQGRRFRDASAELYGAILQLEIELRAGETPQPNHEMIEVAQLIGYHAGESMARSQVAAAHERRGERDVAIEVLKPAVLRERPVAGNSIGLMVNAQLAYTEGRPVPDEIVARSRQTNHRKHLATVLCAAALYETGDSARRLLVEAFDLLSPVERESFIYFVAPTEVAETLGFDDLVPQATMLT